MLLAGLRVTIFSPEVVKIAMLIIVRVMIEARTDDIVSQLE